MKKVIPILIAIVLILIVGGVAVGTQLIEKYSYSNEQADLYEFFHVVKENEVAILLQDDLLEEKAVIDNGVYYIDLATVHTYFNNRFYIDPVEQLLLYTTPTEIIRTAIGTNTYSINDEEKDAGYKISFTQNDGDNTTYYIAMDYVKQYSNFSYETFDSPNRMQVYTKWEENQVADISSDTSVRILGGVKSAVVRKINSGDKVTILEKMETWCKVKTNDALIGYVENKHLTNERAETMTPVTDYKEPEYTSLTKDKKICLGWHAIYSAAGNDTIKDVTASAKSLTILAPTWFSIMDNTGSLQNFATKSYVESAHKKGLEVWGVVDDFNYKNSTHADIDDYKILAATTTRTMLINNIIQAATDCGMDGINIDFESVSADAGEHFVEFLRELSIKCRAAGLILSVDNYVPYNFNSYYHLEEQGVVCDYVVIMGYDEHYAGDNEAGSVASIGYVDYGMQKTCEMVPSTKVINALPFYTRLWKTTGVEISSEAYPMTSVDSVLATYGMEKNWNDEAGQNYAEVTNGDILYQMWIEDAQSISVKLNVMQKYQLGGVAAWRLGYEPAGIWDLIEAYLAQ